MEAIVVVPDDRKVEVIDDENVGRVRDVLRPRLFATIPMAALSNIVGGEIGAVRAVMYFSVEIVGA